MTNYLSSLSKWWKSFQLQLWNENVLWMLPLIKHSSSQVLLKLQQHKSLNLISRKMYSFIFSLGKTSFFPPQYTQRRKSMIIIIIKHDTKKESKSMNCFRRNWGRDWDKTLVGFIKERKKKFWHTYLYTVTVYYYTTYNWYNFWGEKREKVVVWWDAVCLVYMCN